MSIVACPQCKTLIPPDVETCPNCGTPKPANNRSSPKPKARSTRKRNAYLPNARAKATEGTGDNPEWYVRLKRRLIMYPVATLGTILVVYLVVNLVFDGGYTGSAPVVVSSRSTVPAINDAQCRQQISCWGERHYTQASVYCESATERQTTNEVKWTHRWESNFTFPIWVDPSAGIIGLNSRQVAIKNTFGSWVPVEVSCFYNPSTERVTRVNIMNR